MATSILDYIFRELAISYLDRHDLGHVNREEISEEIFDEPPGDYEEDTDAFDFDSLEEEDTIIVLESMKMEIPVVAPREGSLKEILVAEGDAITEGQDVAIMEG